MSNLGGTLQLETINYNQSGWHSIHNTNLEKIHSFVESLEITANLNLGRLRQIASKQFQLEGQSDVYNSVIVQGRKVFLISPKINDLETNNTIMATGEDSGSLPAANITYYVYLSNNQVPTALQEKLRLSEVAPTLGYLATNWRCLGTLKTSASGEIEYINDQLAIIVRDFLQSLTGENRLDATGIKGLTFPNFYQCFHDNAMILTGNSIEYTIDSLQAYNFQASQRPEANGDSFKHEICIDAGNYNFYILGHKHNSHGILDWYLDDVLFLSGQDWYNNPKIYNVILSGTLAISVSGKHILKGTVNGKNPSSSSYAIELTKYWLRKI